MTRTPMFRRKPKPRKPIDTDALAARVVRGDDRPTQPLPEPGTASDGNWGEEPETRRVDPPGTASVAPPVSETRPAVGALLVISGPGSGRLLAFGRGVNAIGRAGNQQVVVDFGDHTMANERHAAITADRHGAFYLQPGDEPHLTYLQGEPLLEPTRLASGDRFVLGATELLFRPLIGKDFDWPADAP